jgi:hypothetical protein
MVWRFPFRNTNTWRLPARLPQIIRPFQRKKHEQWYTRTRCTPGKWSHSRAEVTDGFSSRSAPRCYKQLSQDKLILSDHSRVEVGSNTSNVALRVAGDDKKGSLKSETVNYGRESHKARTRE